MSDQTYNDSPYSSNDQQPTLNSTIVAAFIIAVFVVALFFLLLHVCVRCLLTNSSTALGSSNLSWRSRLRAGQGVFLVGGSTGLDRAIIDSLPTFVYEAPQAAAKEATLECAVCLSEFQADQLGRLLPKCNHRFHTECIDAWFQAHSTCPLCRTTVTPESSTDAERQQDIESAQASVPQNRAGSAGDAISGPAEGALPVYYPTNVLFWGDHSRVSSRFTSPSLKRDDSATGRLPQISIDVPRRGDDVVISSGCSLPSELQSPREQAAASSSQDGQPLKSPSVRVSIKRLLSRGRDTRIDQEGGKPV